MNHTRTETAPTTVGLPAVTLGELLVLHFDKPPAGDPLPAAYLLAWLHLALADPAHADAAVNDLHYLDPDLADQLAAELELPNPWDDPRTAADLEANQ